MSLPVTGLIIGNEVLTAKVAEANGALLIRRCRERGIELRALHVVRDEVDEIVEQLVLIRRRSGIVITSGGVGPTHDDVTVRAVALALHRQVVRLPEMEALIRGYYGDRPVPPQALRMSEAPEGATLLPSSDARFPVLGCDGVFMLPGVPQLFRVHLEAVLAQIPGRPLSLRQLFLRRNESEIAAALDAVAKASPHVAVGSYPTWGRDTDHSVRLTIEHPSELETLRVVDQLKSALGAEAIVREDASISAQSDAQPLP